MNNLNKILENNITETMKKTKRNLEYCPRCHSRIKTAKNTYMGISVLEVRYCDGCGLYSDYEE